MAISIIAGSFLFYQVIYDDAFIAFRYGYNWVHYGVWNFSPDVKMMSEAYTTLTITLLSIIPAALNIHPYIFIKCFGFLVFIFIIFRIWKRNFPTENKWLALCLLILNWQTYVHVFSGLETILWCALLMEISYVVLSTNAGQKQILLCWLCLLLCLTRPEGVFITLFAFAYLISAKKIKPNYSALAVFLLIGTGYFICRYVHFGKLLPLPFYQKSVKRHFGNIDLILNLLNSFHYILLSIWLFVISRKHTYIKYFGITLLAIFFLFYAKSHLAMNFADRFSYQLFYPFMIIGILVSDLQLKKIKIQILSLVLITLGFIYIKGLKTERFRVLSGLYENMFSGYYYSKSHLNIALKLKAYNQPQLKVFCNEAGIIPYYNHFKYFDQEGLTYAPLCKTILTPKMIDSIQPDLYLYLAPGDDSITFKFIMSLPENNPEAYYKYLLTSSNYTSVGYIECVKDKTYIGIAVNKNSKHYTALCKLGKIAIDESRQNQFSNTKFFSGKYLSKFPKY